MEMILVYPAVLLGLASFPAAFLGGLYLVRRAAVSGGASSVGRRLAMAAFSAAVVGAWWALHRFGGPLARGAAGGSLTVRMIFGYSAYALLPVAAAAAAVCLAGAGFGAATDHARH